MLKVPEKKGKAYQIVKCLLKIYSELEELKREYDEKKRPLLEAQSKVEGEATRFLDRTGQTAAKTELGTLFFHPRTSAKVIDPERFLEYVMTHPEEIMLLETRACMTACRDWQKEHNERVPGVELRTEYDIQIRKPTP